MAKSNIKVLLSKLGLDVHSRGVFIVAKILRDAGMEVIYLGNSMPDAIIKAAVQEDADIIGCLLYTSPSPRDRTRSRMPSSA